MKHILIKWCNHSLSEFQKTLNVQFYFILFYFTWSRQVEFLDINSDWKHYSFIPVYTHKDFWTLYSMYTKGIIPPRPVPEITEYETQMLRLHAFVRSRQQIPGNYLLNIHRLSTPDIFTCFCTEVYIDSASWNRYQ
jgi:hypothetical protein